MMRILNHLNKWFRGKDLSYYQLFNSMSDPEYLSLLIKSAEMPMYRGVKLPGFLEDTVQRQFSGSFGEQDRQACGQKAHLSRRVRTSPLPICRAQARH